MQNFQPQNTLDGFLKDDKLSKLIKPTDLNQYREVFLNSIVNYGILGHNAIFAHRIVESNDQGLLTNDTVNWLVDRLKQNIGSSILPERKITFESILKMKTECDWDQQPELIRLPQTKNVEEWLSSESSGLWAKMMHAKSNEFEKTIMELNDDDWPLVRTFQYLMSTLLGNPNSTHVIIFTQSEWNLVDYGLVPQDLATLQVHRMLRKYLYDW